MMTYRRWIGKRLVPALELVAYISLTALHAVRMEATTFPYGLLVVALLLRWRCSRIRNKRNERHTSQQSPTN